MGASDAVQGDPHISVSACTQFSQNVVPGPRVAQVTISRQYIRVDQQNRSGTWRPNKHRLTSATEFCNGADYTLIEARILQLTLATCEPNVYKLFRDDAKLPFSRQLVRDVGVSPVPC
jgi:hypothetical protein